MQVQCRVKYKIKHSSSLFLAQKISQRAADSQDCEGPEHDGVPLHGPQPDHHLLGVVTPGEGLLGHRDIQEGAERLPAFPHVEDQQLGLRDLSLHLEHSETQIFHLSIKGVHNIHNMCSRLQKGIDPTNDIVVVLDSDLIIPVPEEPESRLLPIINGSKQSPWVAGTEVGRRETAPSGTVLVLVGLL